MKYILILVVLCSGCTLSRIERPYSKETTTSKDGTVTVKETSADYVTGGTVESLKRYFK